MDKEQPKHAVRMVKVCFYNEPRQPNDIVVTAGDHPVAAKYKIHEITVPVPVPVRDKKREIQTLPMRVVSPTSAMVELPIHCKVMGINWAAPEITVQTETDDNDG